MESMAANGISEGGQAEYNALAGAGMPVWWVNEPPVGLWVRDVPLWYQPSRGQRMEWKLNFKNNPGGLGVLDARQTDIFSCGTNWHCPWRSYVQRSDDPGIGNEVVLISGTGGVDLYDLGTMHHNSQSTIDLVSTNYVWSRQGGTRHTFGYEVVSGGKSTYFLSKVEDAQGHAFTLAYFTTNNVVCLSSITDVDGLATTFAYTNRGIYPCLISKVVSPYGQTNTFEYDSGGRLIQITDCLNLSSSMAYETNNSLRQLITPYGTNTFTLWDTFGGSSDRWAIHVNEMGSRHHFYMYAPGNVTADYTSELPSIDAGLGHTFDSTGGNDRNSFYWPPRAFDRLSDVARTNLVNDSFNVSNVSSNDYLLARQRHWMVATATYYVHAPVTTPKTITGRTLSFERAPSPDGGQVGQITWYDYEGKPANDREGTQSQPRLVAWKLPGGQSRYTYAERNTWGNTTRTIETYGGVSASLRTNWFTYAANGVDLLVRTNVVGARSAYFYNGSHQVLIATNEIGEVTTYAYDGSNRLTGVLASTGLTTTNFYDANGRLGSVIDKDGATALRTNAFTYTNGLILTHTDPRGKVTTNAWDALGRLTSRSDTNGVQRWIYDKLDVVQTVDRLGYTNRYAFDAFRQLTNHTDARTNVTTYQYCSCGSLDAMTDATRTNTTSYFYDNQGRRTATHHPDGYKVTNNFDAMGEMLLTIDSGGFYVTNYFDVMGRVRQASTPAGVLFQRGFTIEDHLAYTADLNDVTTTNNYDGLGRLLARGYTGSGVNSVETFAWGARGLLYSINPLGRGVTNGYDVLGRKTAETNANGEVTQFSYAPGGDLLTLTDGRASATTWAYDAQGRVTSKRDAGGAELFRYHYNANGWLTNRWTPGTNATKGLNTAYAYDKNGSLTTIDYTNSAASPDVTLAYDARHRVISMLDAVGTTAYAYDAAGRLASEDGPWDSDTVSYTYTNRLRSKLALGQPNAGAWEQTYAYDLAQHLTNSTSPAGAFGWLWGTAGDPNHGGLIKRVTLPNGAYVTNTFDTMARLLSTTLKNSSHATLNTHGYELNNGHQRTNQTRWDGSYMDYTYDPIGQLKTALGKESGGSTDRLHEQFRYTYDAAGNVSNKVANVLTNVFNVNSLNELTTITRTTNLTLGGFTTTNASSVTVNGASATKYADNTFAKASLALVDGNNTFTAIATDAAGRGDTNALTLSLPATTTFAYDLNGNLITNGVRFFEYEAENQLARVTEPSVFKSEFAYDGKRRLRVSRDYEWRSSAWVQTNEVRRVYDGMLVIQERNEFNLPTLSYTHGLDLSASLQGAGGIGGLVAMTVNWKLASGGADAHAYYHADGNGNVTALVDMTQRIVARYLFDPFGNTLAATGPWADLNLYRFSSKEWHQPSGLVSYLYRFYEPRLQRWLNRDAIAEVGGLNLYGFVGNGPTLRIDPFGLDYGGPSWPPSMPPSMPYNPPYLPPKPPQYPPGFSLCQRDFQKNSSCDISTMIGNLLGGEHNYLQYASRPEIGPLYLWGWGFGPGGTVSELHFDPNTSKPCKKGLGTLQYGSGTGKTGSSATDADIQDCIRNAKPSKPYSTFGYNCHEWANEAASKCGLNCN